MFYSPFEKRVSPLNHEDLEKLANGQVPKHLQSIATALLATSDAVDEITLAIGLDLDCEVTIPDPEQPIGKGIDNDKLPDFFYPFLLRSQTKRSLTDYLFDNNLITRTANGTAVALSSEVAQLKVETLEGLRHMGKGGIKMIRLALLLMTQETNESLAKTFDASIMPDKDVQLLKGEVITTEEIFSVRSFSRNTFYSLFKEEAAVEDGFDAHFLASRSKDWFVTRSKFPSFSLERFIDNVIQILENKIKLLQKR